MKNKILTALVFIGVFALVIVVFFGPILADLDENDITSFPAEQIADSERIDITLDMQLDEGEQMLQVTDQIEVSTDEDFANSAQMNLNGTQNETEISGWVSTEALSVEKASVETLYLSVPKYFTSKELDEPIHISGINAGIFEKEYVDYFADTTADENTDSSPYVINYGGEPWQEIVSITENVPQTDGTKTVTVTIDPIGEQNIAPGRVELKINGTTYQSSVHITYDTETYALQSAAFVFDMPTGEDVDPGNVEIIIYELRELNDGFVTTYSPGTATE